MMGERTDGGEGFRQYLRHAADFDFNFDDAYRIVGDGLCGQHKQRKKC